MAAADKLSRFGRGDLKGLLADDLEGQLLELARRIQWAELIARPFAVDGRIDDTCPAVASNRSSITWAAACSC